MNRDDYIERISKMIRDEYSIAPENFLWAERYLKGMLSEENQNNNARILLVELYEHRENRDLLACGRLCEEGLLIEPSNIALIGKLTRIREKRDESDRLIEFFEALYSKNKQNDILVETLIDIYIKHGRCDDAASLMLSSKKRPIFELYQGDIELALGRKDKAIALWRSAANENHRDCELLFKIAERFDNIHDIDVALQLYQQSYEAAPVPKELDALYAQAFLYTKIKKNAEAIDVWKMIIKSLAEDYGVEDGECVDWAKREIQKLS